MISGAIPFQIPAQYLARVDAGEFLRYGAILKNASDGRIVAHLQQTGVFDYVLNNSMSGLGQLTQAVATPVGALSSIATIERGPTSTVSPIWVSIGPSAAQTAASIG